MKIDPWRRDYAFTLMELMIVVAIVGILAAVGIPLYINYVKQSKTVEVAAVLQGICEKEETFFMEFKHYSNNLDWYPYSDGDSSNPDTCGKQFFWGTAAYPTGWQQLGFAPDGPTYYTYSVTTAYGAQGFVASGPTNIPGTIWRDVNPHPWYYAQATGDIDCDGQRPLFYISSQNKSPIQTNAATGEIDETVY